MASADEIKAMMEEIKRLRMENDDFKKRQKPVHFEVNEKGAIAVHGIGKFPCNLYKTQWLRILEKSEDLKQFIKDNESSLN
jgi:regulator of replication initiation timing